MLLAKELQMYWGWGADGYGDESKCVEIDADEKGEEVEKKQFYGRWNENKEEGGEI